MGAGSLPTQTACGQYLSYAKLAGVEVAATRGAIAILRPFEKVTGRPWARVLRLYARRSSVIACWERINVNV